MCEIDLMIGSVNTVLINRNAINQSRTAYKQKHKTIRIVASGEQELLVTV